MRLFSRYRTVQLLKCSRKEYYNGSEELIVAIKTARRGGVTVGRWTAIERSKLRLTVGHCCIEPGITVLGKMFTPLCLCHEAV